MFIAPLVIITILVIAFPTLMRFVFGLLVFGALFMVASCIDHAHAAEVPSDLTGAFRSCMATNAQDHRADLFKIRSGGGDDVLVLAGSCQGLLDAYMVECQKVRSTEKCFIDVKLMSYKAIQDSMN